MRMERGNGERMRSNCDGHRAGTTGNRLERLTWIGWTSLESVRLQILSANSDYALFRLMLS